MQKSKKILIQNIPEIQDRVRRQNLRKRGIEESEDSQLKEPANIFNKIIEENFSNLKKEMPMHIHETYRIQVEWTRKKFFLSHNNQNMKCTKQRKYIKSSKEKRASNI